MSCFVICREDTRQDGSKGKYVMATSRSFDCWDTAEKYAGTIDSSREPKVLADQDGIGELIRSWMWIGK
jgi:hypothetical protein